MAEKHTMISTILQDLQAYKLSLQRRITLDYTRLKVGGTVKINLTDGYRISDIVKAIMIRLCSN